MKKITIVCFAFLLIGVTGVKAQGILDKIDKTIDKADRAGNTADRAGKTGSKLGGLFGKKKNAKANAETKTTINLSGVTFASIKTINENVQASKEVASTKMKYSASGSTIVVQHSGSTEELFKTLQKVSPTTFSEKNLQGLDDGEISVKLN